MSTYSLFQDVHDLLTIVREDVGWPGAYWSNALFVVDALCIATGCPTELGRKTKNWRARLEMEECIASWERDSGQLSVWDETPGRRAERYLGICYDADRWKDLEPDVFRVALLAGASCRATASATAEALASAPLRQCSHLSRTDWDALLAHQNEALREVARAAQPFRSARAAARSRAACGQLRSGSRSRPSRKSVNAWNPNRLASMSLKTHHRDLLRDLIKQGGRVPADQLDGRVLRPLRSANFVVEQSGYVEVTGPGRDWVSAPECKKPPHPATAGAPSGDVSLSENQWDLLWQLSRTDRMLADGVDGRVLRALRSRGLVQEIDDWISATEIGRAFITGSRSRRPESSSGTSTRARSEALHRAIDQLEHALPRDSEIPVGAMVAHVDDLLLGLRRLARQLPRSNSIDLGT